MADIHVINFLFASPLFTTDSLQCLQNWFLFRRHLSYRIRSVTGSQRPTETLGRLASAACIRIRGSTSKTQSQNLNIFPPQSKALSQAYNERSTDTGQVSTVIIHFCPDSWCPAKSGSSFLIGSVPMSSELSVKSSVPGLQRPLTPPVECQLLSCLLLTPGRPSTGITISRVSNVYKSG